ncbi:MAG: tRNA (adenosine(37)-N6)-threonylcarbamoyltransferase complex ATPase subunit type 1 TsaE [Chlamydiia bacterium]|nr:tRNA (adenosine(37)-N6)-threonylcarbamoyltransferase complex ATPase subunit type 1 TsaE [Chlamydiia bacterium]
MQEKQFLSSSPEETQRIGYELGKSISAPAVICLWGDLGAGKTTLSKGLVAGIAGVDTAEITSPTFTYLNVYNGPCTAYHFDLYRLQDADEFLGMGFDEFLFGEGIACIEWPERIMDLLPKRRIDIFLSAPSLEERKIDVTDRTQPNGKN